MKIKYNKEVDVLLIQFSENKIMESDEPKPGVIIDYDQLGKMVRIEVLDASKNILSPAKMEYELVG